MSEQTAAFPRDEGRCSVLNCNRPGAVAYRAGVMFEERCAAHMSLPSARAALVAGLAVRKSDHKHWAIYPNDWGSFDLYPGDEGPQRELPLDEVLSAIGGDQQCYLAPAGVLKWPTLDEPTKQRVLAGISPDGSAPSPTPLSQSARDGWWQLLDRAETASEEVQRLVDQGKVSAAQARPILIALENDRHECALKSL